MVEEVVRDAAGEDDHLNLRVLAQFLDNCMQPRDGLRDDQIHRRIREFDLADLGRWTLYGDRAGLCHFVLLGQM
jgi:hypothetical protein